MKISVTPAGRKENLEPLGITDEELQYAVDTENRKVLPFQEPNHILFFKKMKNGSYLLIDGQWIGNELVLKYAFRIFEHMIVEARSNDPLALLQHLANKFGLFMNVGEQHNKFIFAETIHLDASQKSQNITEILGLPKDHMGFYHVRGTLTRIGSDRYAIVRLAYAIDNTKYLEYAKERMADLDSRS